MDPRIKGVIRNTMANSIDPDETARYEPSHMDLYCLQRSTYWSAGTKELKAPYSSRIDIL